ARLRGFGLGALLGPLHGELLRRPGTAGQRCCDDETNDPYDDTVHVPLLSSCRGALLPWAADATAPFSAFWSDHTYGQSWNLPGPAAKQPSPYCGHITTNVSRLPQSVTPIAYAARGIPCTQGPWRAGYTTAREIMTTVT